MNIESNPLQLLFPVSQKEISRTPVGTEHAIFYGYCTDFYQIVPESKVSGRSVLLLAHQHIFQINQYLKRPGDKYFKYINVSKDKDETLYHKYFHSKPGCTGLSSKLLRVQICKSAPF